MSPRNIYVYKQIFIIERRPPKQTTRIKDLTSDLRSYVGSNKQRSLVPSFIINLTI